MGMDVLIQEPFEREGERRSNKGRRSRERPVIDHIHPYEEVLADFLNRNSIVARSPMLSSWDPTGRSLAHTGSDLEAIIVEVERFPNLVMELRALVDRGSMLERFSAATMVSMPLEPLPGHRAPLHQSARW